MRVSDQSFFHRSRTYLDARRSEVADAQTTASTGRKVRKPSDDPLAASMAIKERAREQRLNAASRSIESGKTRANAQDAALGDVAERLRRALELTMQAANDINYADERASIAVEIDTIRDTIVGLANARDGSDYVFAGFASDSPAFDAAGTFLGDGSVPEVEVGEGIRIDAGIGGDTAFGVGTPDDVFAVLADLSTALNANDEVGIRDGLGRLQSAHEGVTTARSSIGGLQVGLDGADSITARLRDGTIERQSTLVAANETDAYLDLQRTTQAYQAAVQIAAQLPPPGLASR